MDQGKLTVSPIYLYNGKLLVVDGKLATGQNCCCDNATNPPEETACADQCKDVVLAILGDVTNTGPSDMSANINALENAGYTNVTVNITTEDGQDGFVFYTYNFTGTCCGDNDGPGLEIIQGYLIPPCICNE